MKTAEFKKGTRNPLPWILVGAIVAPIVMLLFSFLLGNSELREIPVLLIVPVAGAVAGWIIYAINPLGRPRGWRKPILLFLALLVYFMAVVFGYTIAHVGGY